MVDLTGGMGVDTYYFSQNFGHVDYVEQQAELCRLTTHNLNALGSQNITTHSRSATSYLKGLAEKTDLIYIDPARRDGANKKVFRLSDCEPNVIEMLPDLIKSGKQLLIKTSPLLDIGQSIDDLKYVSKVYVVSVNNDCKEVLYFIDSSDSEIEINTVNFLSDGGRQEFSFSRVGENSAKSNLSFANNWLYEPNAAIMKAGAFKSIGVQYNLDKLHQHTHLYTSTSLIENFPGRSFEIKEIVPYNKKSVMKCLPDKKANITTRNFPVDVATIRTKMGLKDGGDIYVFALTDLDNNLKLVICEKS